jgi:5-methylcytosine-specific restriction endonuclease McrA
MTTTALNPPSTARAAARGCLALNASYEPLTVIAAARAVRLVLENRAEIVEADPVRRLRSAGAELPCPAVIRLARYVHVPRKLLRGVSNLMLFARDGYRCAYCGRPRSELRSREFLTRDHIVPQVWFKTHGGDPNTWANVACACSTCNGRKGDLSLAEFTRATGMRLRIVPAEPRFVHLEWAVRSLTPLQRKYVTEFFGADAADALR